MYAVAEEASKQKLGQSKARLDQVDDELHETFKHMEENVTAEQRDIKELENGLEMWKLGFDLVIATNPDVIDQYEQHGVEVRIIYSSHHHWDHLIFLFTR